jgi:hypothetical protein
MNKWTIRIGIFILALDVAIALAACDMRPKKQWNDAPKPAPSMGSGRQPPPSMRIARMGDPCTQVGENAKTASGNPLVCILRPGEREPRWRIP